MNALHIAPSYNLTKSRYVTPLVVLSAAKKRGVIKSCDAVDENASAFEEAVCAWIDELFTKGGDEFHLSVKIYYSNTTMTKALLTVVELLEAWYKRGKRVELRWWYDVEDYDDSLAKELQDDIKACELTLPVKFISYNR